jgi:hypothetical protein
VGCAYTKHMTEQQPYEVLKRYPGFELRRYPAGFQIETEVEGEFVRAGNLGFGPLVRFISGANSKAASISMTAPVIQEGVGENRHLVRFVLPSGIKPEQIPQPVDGRVQVIAVAEHLACAKRFSGSWSSQRFEEKGEQLISEMLTEGLEPEGSLYSARFDPPWKPGFLKRNEVLVRVRKK